jgi:hypothetical protein
VRRRGCAHSYLNASTPVAYYGNSQVGVWARTAFRPCRGTFLFVCVCLHACLVCPLPWLPACMRASLSAHLPTQLPAFVCVFVQGGILGGAYMAVSSDITRGVLGETGCNYALLLSRSVDFSGATQCNVCSLTRPS